MLSFGCGDVWCACVRARATTQSGRGGGNGGGHGDDIPLERIDAKTRTPPSKKAFHALYKGLCDAAGGGAEAAGGLGLYARYKKTCDDYFYLPARKEHRCGWTAADPFVLWGVPPPFWGVFLFFRGGGRGVPPFSP